MKEFRLNLLAKMDLFSGFFYSFLFLGVFVAISIVVIASDYVAFKSWAKVLFPIAIIWNLVRLIDGIKTMKWANQYKVVISDQGIQVDDINKDWEEIKKIEVTTPSAYKKEVVIHTIPKNLTIDLSHIKGSDLLMETIDEYKKKKLPSNTNEVDYESY